jgi:uncharacterized membrane protein YqjE
MAAQNNHLPGFTSLVGRVARTGLGVLRNRLELLAVEWEEERLRMMQLVGWAMALVFAGVLAALLFTATIIFLFRAELRPYVAAGFTILYAAAAVWAWFGLRKLLKRVPFAETINQAEKDREWLESLS